MRDNEGRHKVKMYAILTAMVTAIASPAVSLVVFWSSTRPTKNCYCIYVSFTCDNTLLLASRTQRFRFILANGLFGAHFSYKSLSNH